MSDYGTQFEQRQLAVAQQQATALTRIAEKLTILVEHQADTARERDEALRGRDVAVAQLGNANARCWELEAERDEARARVRELEEQNQARGPGDLT